MDEGRKLLYTVQERRERFLKRVKSKRERELVNALQAVADGILPENLDAVMSVRDYAKHILVKYNLYKESK